MVAKKDYFKTFCKVNQAFSTTLGKEKLLDLIVQSVVDTMGAKAACLWLADIPSGEFLAVSQKGLSKKYFKTNLRSDKIISRVVKKDFLYTRDATTDPMLEDHKGKKAEGIASMLIVPVKVKNKVIGILSLYTAETRDFSRDEIDFLSALADQGGVAIENARLIERIQKNSELFLELASDINSSLDIKTILHSLTEEICKSLGMKGVSIRLINDETGNIDLVASHGLSDEYLNKGSVSAEKSISDALKGETIVIKNVVKEKRLQYREETEKEGIVSMVCVPIKLKDKVIGVMRLCSENAREYPDDFLVLVNAIAHTGALAIQNASMYLALQDAKESLEKDIWRHRSYF